MTPEPATTIERAPAASPALHAPPEIVIRPRSGWVGLQLGEVWRFRELAFFLTWRDVKVRYKQTALGAAWAVIQPVFTMLVFALFFGRLGKLPSDDIPYPLFSFCALVPWTFFSTGLSQSANSLVGSADLLKKVYFPRLLIPISTVMSGAIDLAISFSVLIAMMAYYGVAPGPRIVFLPLFVLLAVVAGLGVGLWLAALNVMYRDVRYVIPFMTQFWLFATPIAYPSSMLSEPWRSIYGINPMVGVVEGFRWALVHGPQPSMSMTLASAAAAVVLLVGGALYFKRMERHFADLA